MPNCSALRCPELPDEPSELIHLRPQLGLHLVQPGVDDVLLGGQIPLAGGQVSPELLALTDASLLQEVAMVGRDLVQLLALQDGGLLQRGMDGGVPLRCRLLLHRGHRGRQGRGHPRRHGVRRRRFPQNGERDQQPYADAEDGGEQDDGW